MRIAITIADSRAHDKEKNDNLGTLVSLLSKDWEHLDLNVTEDDLMHRGPGLVLDHMRSDGGRIVLWSE